MDNKFEELTDYYGKDKIFECLKDLYDTMIKEKEEKKERKINKKSRKAWKSSVLDSDASSCLNDDELKKMKSLHITGEDYECRINIGETCYAEYFYDGDYPDYGIDYNIKILYEDVLLMKFYLTADQGYCEMDSQYGEWVKCTAENELSDDYNYGIGGVLFYGGVPYDILHNDILNKLYKNRKILADSLINHVFEELLYKSNINIYKGSVLERIENSIREEISKEL